MCSVQCAVFSLYGAAHCMNWKKKKGKPEFANGGGGEHWQAKLVCNEATAQYAVCTCTVYYTVCSVQCAVVFSLYTLLAMLHTVHCTLHGVYCMQTLVLPQEQCSGKYVHFTLYCTVCTSG